MTYRKTTKMEADPMPNTFNVLQNLRAKDKMTLTDGHVLTNWIVRHAA